MKIILTGGSGFLGKILLDKLSKQYEVITLGRGQSNELKADLSKEIPDLPSCDLIIHAAGKAHVVPKTEKEVKEFFKVNLQGTQNLLAGLKDLPKTFIFISSVSVYGLEEGEFISEHHPLSGTTPYAKSKIEAEKLVINWGEKNKVPVLILRLPLIVGKDAPGNLGAMVKAIQKGYYRRIGEGKARKSMVLAQDLAAFLPKWTGNSGIYNLTDGDHPTMAQLDDYLSQYLGRKVKSLPVWVLRALAKVGDIFSFFPFNTARLEKLEFSLTFSDEKARKELGWAPHPIIGNFDPRT